MTVRALIRRALLASGLLSGVVAPAALAEKNPVYVALRAARPQGPGVSVAGLVLERDVFRFRFESGAFTFLAPVEGKTIGAVFVGQGSYELKPASEEERAHLALVTGEKQFSALADRFESAVLFFTDKTAEEVRQKGTPLTGGTDPNAIAAFEKTGKKQRRSLKTNLQLRLLPDILAEETAGGGVFLVFVNGKKMASSLAVVDPEGVERVGLASLLAGEEVAFLAEQSDNWDFLYLSHRAPEVSSGPRHPSRPLAEALHYAVDTTIQKNSSIQGTTTIRLRPLVRLRVLPIQLMPKLRIGEAGFRKDAAAPWSPAAFAQEAADEDGDAAVIFPAPLAAGEPIELKVSYSGTDVLTNVGDQNYVVGARESWYPNFGAFSNPATFDLTYRIPKSSEVVSVGAEVENRVEENTRIATWKAQTPIRVAGFNYGKFKRLERVDSESGLKIVVYTNPGKPDILHELEGIPTLGHIDTSRLAESALVDALNATRLCSAYFGRLPQPQIAVTQQSQWTFGQSWPSLIFLPYLAFLDSTQRHSLGLNLTGDVVEEIAYHEVAHQWWGHVVGWATYRDQWLSEGFAEFAAALVVRNTRGASKFNDFWERARREILERGATTSVRNFEAGPISLGWRLSTRRSPDAYFAGVYRKGAYVLHMLRMLMQDPRAPNPDAQFIEMMNDYVRSYSGKSPSTADFQAVVERHLTPAMDVTKDGRMDWFFRQWISGTQIPRYVPRLEIKDAGPGQYQITGTVAQEEVGEDFYGLVRMYFEFDRGEFLPFGRIAFRGSAVTPVDLTIKLPRKPRRVVLNAFHDVLTRD